MTKSNKHELIESLTLTFGPQFLNSSGLFTEQAQDLGGNIPGDDEPVVFQAACESARTQNRSPSCKTVRSPSVARVTVAA